MCNRYVCACLLLNAGLLAAQTTQGSIAGRVADTRGMPLSNANVRFERVTGATGESIESGVASTGPAGDYQLPLLSPGSYRLRVEYPEHQVQQSNIELHVAARLEANFTLPRLTDIWRTESEVEVDVGDSSAIVSYFAADVEQLRLSLIRLIPAATMTRAATLSYVMEGRALDALPLNGRDSYSALTLQPGVASDHATGRGLGLAVTGMRPTASNFMLDGLENNNYLISGPLTAVAPEAVQEYRISANNFSAEYGRAAGYIANAITAAGTGSWHGTGYFNLKNTVLNANEFQANRIGAPRRPFRETQPGVSIGGPVLPRRLFASAAWETRRSRSQSEPFDVDVLSPEAIDYTQDGSTARMLLTTFPTPAADAGDGFVTRIRAEPPQTLNRSLVLARLDYVPESVPLRISGRIAAARAAQPDFIWSPYEGFTSELKQPSNSLAVSAIYLLSSRWANEARFGWSRDDLRWDRPHPEIPTMEISNSFEQVLLPGSPAAYEYRNLGRSQEWNDNLMFAGAGHAVKFGGGILQRRLKGYLTYGRDGFYSFQNTDEFFLARNLPRTLRIAVDRASLPELTIPNYEREYKYLQYHAYVEDTFRLGTGLSLNPGLRYENFGVPVVAGPVREAVLRPGTGYSFAERLAHATMVVPGLGKQRLYRGRTKDFAARFGVTWAPLANDSTVMRGAYGIFYDRPFDNLWQNHRNNNIVDATLVYRGAADNYLPAVNALRSSAVQPFGTDFPQPLFFDPNFSTGYAQQYFINLEHRTGGAVTFSVSGSGSQGRRLITTDIVNRSPASDAVVRQIAYRAPQGKSSYHALSVLTRWNSRRSGFQAAYTLSHSIDNQSDPIAGDFFDLAFTSLSRRTQPRRPRAAFSREFDSNADRGNSDFDQRHNLVFWGHVSAPAALAGNRWGILFRGWTMACVGALRTGFPYSVFAPATGEIINQRADLIDPAHAVSGDSSVPGGRQLLRRDAFAEPATGMLGNSGRNAFRAPGFYNLDVSVARAFRLAALGETGRLTIRADAYNALNHANLGPPDAFVRSADFGLATFGRRGAAAGFPALAPLDEIARQVQLILRIQF
jgi:hypothetical protein